MLKQTATYNRSKLLLQTTALFALIGTSVLTPSPILAQDDAAAKPSRLDNIVVTARRREENLQSVPVAVTAITAEKLERENIVQVDDLKRITPSLNISETVRTSSTPSFAIRGISTEDFGTATDPAVTVYFDEYGVTKPTGANQLMFDLQSVQVLKGPQGTLFGRNTTGGAILVTANEPTDEIDGYVKVSGGDFELRDFEAVVNVPVADGVAFRLAGKKTQREGYLTNVLTGEDLQDRDALGLRGSLKLDAGENITSTTTGLYFENRSNGSASKLKLIAPTLIPAAGLLGPQLTAEFAATQALGDYEIRSSVKDFVSTDTVSGVQNKTSWDLGDSGLTLKNIVGYRRIISDYSQDVDGSGLVLVEFPGRVQHKQFSEELQLQGQIGIVDFVTGLFYFKEEAKDETRSIQFLTLVLAGLPPGVTPQPVIQDFDAKNSSYAAFVHFNVDAAALMEGLSVSAGARLTKDEREVVVRTRNPTYNLGTSSFDYRCAATGVLYTSPDRNLCGVKGTASFTEPTYNLSLNYQLDDDTLLYLSHRHGYKTGGLNARTAAAGQPISSYDPEFVDDIELGWKTDFSVNDVAGRLNIALFHTWYEDAQRSQNRDLVIGGGTPTTTNEIINAASASVNGAEIELLLQPTDNLEINLGYSYVHAEYDEWQDTIIVGGVPTKVDISDSEFSEIPEHQLSGSIRYTLPLGPEYGELAVQASGYYQTEIFGQQINTANCGPGGVYTQCYNHALVLDGYHTIDLRADWAQPFGLGLDLSAFVTNVTDEFYETQGFGLMQIGFAASGIGAPRMFGLSASIPFGASAY